MNGQAFGGFANGLMGGLMMGKHFQGMKKPDAAKAQAAEANTTQPVQGAIQMPTEANPQAQVMPTDEEALKPEEDGGTWSTLKSMLPLGAAAGGVLDMLPTGDLIRKGIDKSPAGKLLAGGLGSSIIGKLGGEKAAGGLLGGLFK